MCMFNSAKAFSYSRYIAVFVDFECNFVLNLLTDQLNNEQNVLNITGMMTSLVTLEMEDQVECIAF